MAEKFIYCSTGLADWDIWQVAAKEAQFQEYCNQYSQGLCETRTAYEDRITGIIQDTRVKLADDNTTINSDRLIDPYIDHPTDPNKIISAFDDAKTSDPLNIAYYCTQEWRTANVGGAFQILDQAGAEVLGFDFGSGDDN